MGATLQVAAEGPRWTSQEWTQTLLGELGLSWGVASVGTEASCGTRLAPAMALQELLPPKQLQTPSLSEPCHTGTIDLHYHMLANTGRLRINTFGCKKFMLT